MRAVIVRSFKPASICLGSTARLEIRLLNEDTATDIRIATNLAQLAAGQGALIPWPNNSYTALATQGELYAIGSTGAGTPRLSVIEVFEEELGT